MLAARSVERKGESRTRILHATSICACHFVDFEPLNSCGLRRSSTEQRRPSGRAAANHDRPHDQQDDKGGPLRKALTTLTIGILAIAVAVMAVAGISAPKSSATSSLCHSSTLSITAPATVKAGKSITVTGAEAQSPAHTVSATLQYRLSTVKKWTNGKSTTLSSGGYTLKWKAPAKKGKYKVRVRVTHSGASNTSASKTVTVN
jgi:hypothetical protein